MKRSNFPARKEQRRKEAIARQMAFEEKLRNNPPPKEKKVSV